MRNAKETILKKILNKHTGKGGPKSGLFEQASSPINLLKSGEPPTASSIPKTGKNS